MSHRWTDDEVLFGDVEQKTAITRSGYFKLKGAILQARADGYAYLWDDTCCIDKSSGAELSEAINSMWVWYQGAAICYAYLCDVSFTSDAADFETQFCASAWFTRGWTLQELIAPSDVVFYNGAWSFLGTRQTLHQAISRITGIEAEYLNHEYPLSRASIAKRLSWAAHRQTTRLEDIAYSLMGIFSVNMPMLYGEGERAFQRLQEEILRTVDDESIFAWVDKDADPGERHGLLADNPRVFQDSGDISPRQDWSEGDTEPPRTTSRGLNIQRSRQGSLMPLFCQYADRAGYLCVSVVGNHLARNRLGELQSATRIEKLESLYFPQVPPDCNRYHPIENRLMGVLLNDSKRTTLFYNYRRMAEIKGLHPGHESYTVGILTESTIPKDGTFVAMVFRFRRTSDQKCLTVLVGSLNATDLGFCAEHNVAQRVPMVTTIGFAEYNPIYVQYVVPIGSSVLVGTSHRVSITQTQERVSRIGYRELVLEVDIEALDEPVPGASCCCLQ